MLEAAARECGLVLTGDMLDALTEYWRYLVEVNAHMNLTAVTSDEEAVWRHFMDSLAPVRAGLLPPGARARPGQRRGLSRAAAVRGAP